MTTTEYMRALWLSRGLGKTRTHEPRERLEIAKRSALDNYGEDPFRYEPGDTRAPR